MPMVTSAVRFASEIELAKRQEDVVDLLHTLARVVGVNVLSLWRLPPDPDDWNSVAIGNEIIPQKDVPKEYWREMIAGLRKYGYADMDQYARRQQMPFTWTESMRVSKPRGTNRWIYTLLHKYGMHDGLIVPIAGWRVAYWSPKELRLSSRGRNMLIIAAALAVGRVRAIRIAAGTRERRVRYQPLSSRELAALQFLSNGRSVEQAASDIGVSVPSVKTFIQRAQKKLKVDNPHHAVAKAIRLSLIP